MKPVGPLGALGIGAACAFGAPALSAQVTNALDAGVSVVRYDGFLSSGAASVTPSLRYDAPHFSALARGSLLVFESGNVSLQGSISGGAFSPKAGPVRFEVAGETGASTYAEFARFAHVLGELRAHWMSRSRGIWAGTTAGRTAYADTAYAVRGWEAGAWARAAGVWLSTTWTVNRVGDTTYSDATTRARWSRGRLDGEASLGARFGSRGGGRGSFGEVSAVAWLADGLALVAAGGRYASDPARSSIPGSYASVSMRLGRRARTRVSVPAVALRLRSAGGPSPATVGASFELGHAADGTFTFRIRAETAVRVELMGDFSDWQPMPLVRADGVWEVSLPLRAGIYRFNVRIDGGEWGVPSGVEGMDDDFGGAVGIVVIP